MRRGDFLNHLRRLTSGFNKSETDLTEERVSALHSHFNHVSEDVWEAAVSRMLLGDRYPSIAVMEECVDKCAERASYIQKAQHERHAKEFWAGGAQPIGELSEMEPAYWRLCFEIIRGTFHHGLKPSDVARVLRSQRDKFVDPKTHHAIDAWLPELDDFGDSWPVYCEDKVYRRDLRGNLITAAETAVMEDGRRIRLEGR